MRLPETCDYLIVGGGSAGCVLANRLSEDPRKTVVLLEAGGDDRPSRNPGAFMAYCTIHMPAGYARLLKDRRFDWADVTESDPSCAGRRHNWSRGRVLGGGSSINGSIYIRGQAEDYDHWRQLGCEGWSADDVLPFFRKAEDQQRGEDEWHGVGGPLAVSDLTESHPVSDAWIAACEQAGIPRNDDFNGADQEGAGYFQLTQKRGRRCSAAVGYLEPVRSRPNLSIVTGVLAERILIDNGRVTGVACRIDGKEHLLRARGEVVLTAGALGSPKLLQLSGIGPAERLRAIGIDVVRDLPGVGGNLQDHYTASLLWRLKAHVPSVNARAHGLALLREIAAYMFQRRGLLTLSPGNIGVFCKSRPELATPDIEFCCFPASPDISKAHKSTLVLERDPGLTTAFNILRPQSRGQVWLRSSDPAEPIAIQPNYLDSQADADVIVAGFKWARRIARQPAMAELIDHEFLPGPQVETDEQILGYCRAAGGTGYHPTGTCAMGHGAATAVDPRLRVHGVAGLRVADASIMPTIVSGNTNAPTIMIAEKAAAMILQDAAAWTIGHTTPTHALPRS